MTIIIPSKSASNLVPCVRAIRDAGEIGRIIVVDDGIDWSEASQLVGDDFSVQLVPGVKDFIFARNVNIGIREAGDDDCVILNDDALLKTRVGFSLMALAHMDNPGYGVIGAVTNVTGQPLQQPHNIGLREVEHFAFVCVFIPRSTIRKVGLLDERYCLDYGCEDRDYCEAVTRAGLKVGVYDGCYVDHGSLTSSFRGDPRTPKSFARNFELFRQKWGNAG